MVEPKSLEANNEVYELAKPQGGITWGPWIGIHDKINEGNFVYVSSNATIVYENWNSGEPNSYMGREEDCVIMGPKPRKWYDAPCEDEQSFVCEKSGELTIIES